MMASRAGVEPARLFGKGFQVGRAGTHVSLLPATKLYLPAFQSAKKGLSRLVSTRNPPSSRHLHVILTIKMHKPRGLNSPY